MPRKKPSPQTQTPPTPIQETVTTKSTTVQTIPAPQPAEKKRLDIKLPKFTFGSMSALAKLRILVGIIFLLSTLAFLFAFSNFAIAIVFILISYVLLLGLLFKLFSIKHL